MSPTSPRPSSNSATARPLVVQTERLDADAAAWLSERADLVACAPGEEPRFSELLTRAEALVVRTYTVVDTALLDRAPRLRVVGRAGVGLDRIDLRACAARGVRVVHTPDANAQAVVEYVGALIFDAIRPRIYLDGPVDDRRWMELRAELRGRRQLSEMTVGVYGLGRIGSRVAAFCRALGARVIFCDLRDISSADRAGAAPVPARELLSRSDALTIHVDGRAENRNLLDARALALLKPDAILINTSRGFVVDAPALGAWLRANPGALALLDVHEPEPFDAAYPLLGLPNARLSPHLAAATASANRAMSWVVKDVWEALRPD